MKSVWGRGEPGHRGGPRFVWVFFGGGSGNLGPQEVSVGGWGGDADTGGEGGGWEP